MKIAKTATCVGGGLAVTRRYRYLERMCTLDDIVTEISQDCADEYRRRMRDRLMQQPCEWLVDQLLEHVLEEAGWVGEAGRAGGASGTDRSDAERLARDARIRAMQIDEAWLASFASRRKSLDRAALERQGYLVAPPDKGGEAIDAGCRTRKGHALLREAKDLLHALLFGDEAAGVRLPRAHRELLTITVPRAKAAPLTALLQAATVIEAEGTWQDPACVADDERRHNTIVQVEYGEAASEAIGHAIALTLRLINDLEINEQVLYARMENVEESTLV